MEDWREIYKSRVMTAKEAAQHIQSGDRIVVGHGPGAPLPILQAIADNKDAYQNVTVCHMVTFGEKPYIGADKVGHISTNTCFVADGFRGALEEGIVDLTPMNFSQFPAFLEKNVDSNVVVVTTTEPDEHGYVCCGMNSDYTIPAARRARTIIAEVNSNCPTVFGDTFIHVSDIECFVKTDRPIAEVASRPVTEVEKMIGGYCAELIQDGATIQMGFGGIPDAILPFLMGKKDLGIHTEIIADGVQLLMEAGVVNGSKKTLHHGEVISTSLFGSAQFRGFADKHPSIRLYPVNYTNDPMVIAKNKNMVSINACLQVDLSGQVNSEYIGSKQFSGMGGQMDFVRGAQMSEGGKSILACSSTAKNDTISKIVPYLEPNAPITVPRTEVDFIVTEYGIAALRGRSLMERAKALINIAHPKFRDELKEEVESRYKRKM